MTVLKARSHKTPYSILNTRYTIVVTLSSRFNYSDAREKTSYLEILFFLNIKHI